MKKKIKNKEKKINHVIMHTMEREVEGMIKIIIHNFFFCEGQMF